MTHHVFISYARKDTRELVSELHRVLQESGFQAWVDRPSLSPEQRWDHAISKAISECSAFLYIVSPSSMTSEEVVAELEYAYEQEKPIIPVLAKEGSWNDVPKAIKCRKYVDFVHNPSTAMDELLKIIKWTLSTQHTRLRTSLADSIIHVTNHTLNIEQEVDRQSQLASLLNTQIGNLRLSTKQIAARVDVEVELIESILDGTFPVSELSEDFLQEIAAAIKLKFKEIEQIVAVKPYSILVDSSIAMGKLCHNLSKPQDPDGNLTVGVGDDRRSRYMDIDNFIFEHPNLIFSGSDNHIPPLRFIEWVEIPASESSTGETDYISKYPITNAQFKCFIDAKGYENKTWWIDAGWSLNEKLQWSQPKYWNDKEFNRPNQPVVGVSWHESLAFCLWLSTETGEKISLPTEQQWQRAAQGDEKHTYPWGNKWDSSKCNSSFETIAVGKTAEVGRYPQGQSPLGVMDMVGNVWEWTSIVEQNINRSSRVVRGGSWSSSDIDELDINSRLEQDPRCRQNNIGFRVLRKIPYEKLSKASYVGESK